MLPLYEQEIAYIDKKIDEFCQKAQLKKPKRKIFKSASPPANSNSLLNELRISEYLLKRWKNGIISKEDIDATIAHEFGHMIDYREKSPFQKLAYGGFSFVYVLILLGLGLSFAFLSAYLVTISYLLAPVIILFLFWFVLVWVLFLPTVLRKAHFADELAADCYAISYSLTDAQQLANIVVNRIGKPLPEKIGPIHRAEIVWNMLSHPYLYEQLENIGIEIEYPIKTKKKVQSV